MQTSSIAHAVIKSSWTFFGEGREIDVKVVPVFLPGVNWELSVLMPVCLFSG